MSLLSDIVFGPAFNYAVIYNGLIVDFCNEARPNAVRLKTISESELCRVAEKEYRLLNACGGDIDQENAIFSRIDERNGDTYKKLRAFLSVEHFKTDGIVRCVGIVTYIGPYQHCDAHIPKEFVEVYIASPIDPDAVVVHLSMLMDTT